MKTAFWLVLMGVGSLVCAQVTRPAATGKMRLTFTERSPLSAFDEMFKRTTFRTYGVGPMLDGYKQQLTYDIATESFEVFVPAGYRDDGTWGLFDWISAGGAELPPEWGAVLARHKLMYVSPNNTGNARPHFARVGLGLDAAFNMTKRYHLDARRVYVGGFSGGGDVAKTLLTSFPDVFNGAFTIGAGGYHGSIKDEAGHFMTTVGAMPFEPVRPLDEIKSDVSIVMMAGQRDPMDYPGAMAAEEPGFLFDGFARVTYIEIPNVGHAMPNGTWFDKGLTAMESKPKKIPTTGPTSDPNPDPGQVAYANRLLATGREFVEGKHPNKSYARRVLMRLLDEYPTTPAAAKARDLLDQLKRSGTQPARGRAGSP